MADTHYEELVERVLQLPYDQQLQLMGPFAGDATRLGSKLIC